MGKLTLKRQAAIVVCMTLFVTACTSDGTESQSEEGIAHLEEEVAQLSQQLAFQSEQIEMLLEQVSTQARELADLQRVSSDLGAEIDSVRGLVQASPEPATDPLVDARLSGLETLVGQNTSVLGAPGNFQDGLWADMEAVLDCLNEILEQGGVATIPNNSCRLIDAGMMGGY